MEIELNSETTLKQAQRRFNEIYPNLWIEFYSPRLPGSFPGFQKLNLETPMKALPGQEIKTIDISPEITVNQLKDEFLHKLGYELRMSRKTGGTWVNIHYSGSWTLGNQNYEAMQIFVD